MSSSPVTPSATPPPSGCPRCGRPVPVGSPLGACPHCLLAVGLPTGLDGSTPDGPPTPSPEELAPEFPGLDIVALLGRGGMGAVYKARQRDLDRLVALKILRPGLDAEPGFAERFTREARALARLNHPGIVTLYEFGRSSAGRYFILMEFVDGVNLRGLLSAGRLSPREALAIVPPLCDALQYAHDLGLVHRDIKPENLLVDRLGRIKIADFGIAKLTTSTATPTAPTGATDAPDTLIGHSSRQTSASNALEDIGHSAEGGGTPAYMAPEQKERPAEVDHRADLYALGVVLYQMLTGELPAPGQLQPPSRRAQIDVRLDEIVLRALAADPARRYATATEFKTRIETIPATPAPPPPTPAAPPSSSPSLSSRLFSPWFFVVLLCGGYLGALALSADHLPSTVATHFDVNGVADDWMSRADYLLFIGIPPCALAALFALTGRTLRRFPARMINLPRRDHWLAPERKADTDALFLRWMAGPAVLLVVLFAQSHLVTLLANQTTPAHFAAGLLLGPVIGFLVALMLWIVGLVLRFAEPDASPRKLRHQARVFLAVGLLSLVLPSFPLISHAARRLKPADTAGAPDPGASLDVIATDQNAPPAETAQDAKQAMTILVEAAPVTLPELAGQLRPLVVRHFPAALIDESPDHFEARFAARSFPGPAAMIGSGGTHETEQPADGPAEDGFILLLARIETPDTGAAALPVLDRNSRWTTFYTAGFSEAQSTGVRVRLALGPKPPESFQTEIMRLIGMIHLPRRSLTTSTGETLPVYAHAFLDGNDLAAVERPPGSATDAPLRLRLTEQGAFRLNQLSQLALGRRMAVLIDDRLVSAPKIMAELAGDTVEISGALSAEDETNLLNALRRPVTGGNPRQAARTP